MSRKENISFFSGMGFFWVFVIICALLFTVGNPSISDARTFRVNNRQDIVDQNPGDGVCKAVETGFFGCTLRAAIMEANAFPGADTIIIGRGRFRLNLTGVSAETDGAIGDLDIRDKLIIVGADKDQTIIDATALLDRIFDIHDGSVVSINGMTLMNGAIFGDQRQDPQLSPKADAEFFCPIIEPLDKADGGAILNRGGIMMITNVRFEGNFVICDGGAVDSINDAVMLLTDCDFEFNTAISDGGAVENDEDSIMVIQNGRFEWNNTSENGGAIANEDSLMWLRDSALQLNSAGAFGGGIWNGDSDVIIVKDTVIKFNDAMEDGGGIFNSDGFLRLKNSRVEMNSPNDVVDENIPED